MTMKRYGADGANLTVFGIPIDDFGDTDPPITIEDLEPRATLKRGIGKTSVLKENVGPFWQLSEQSENGAGATPIIQ